MPDLGDERAAGAEVLFRHRGTLLVLAATPIVVAAFSEVALERWELAAGGAALVTGVAMRLISVRRIGKRARVARAGAATLLSEGAYARVRNPIYLANLATALGACLLAGLAEWTPLVIAFALAIYHAVVRIEEVRLLELFGERYEEYRARVPRWVPRLVPAEPVAPGPPLWPWSQVLRREAGGIAGVAGLFAALVYVRWPGPGVEEALSVLDRAAAALGLGRPWLLAGVTLFGAVAEGFVTYAKRSRHARLRARLLAADGSTEGLRHEVQAHDEG